VEDWGHNFKALGCFLSSVLPSVLDTFAHNSFLQGQYRFLPSPQLVKQTSK